MNENNYKRHLGRAWLILSTAFAIHVIDEAINDFLPLYNSIVESLRDSYSWVPLPTFSFSTWITGLAFGVVLLLGLSPLVFSGKRILRPISYFLGVLMTLNALAHIGGSIYLGTFAPGVVSSPILLLAAISLLIATDRVRRGARESQEHN